MRSHTYPDVRKLVMCAVAQSTLENCAKTLLRNPQPVGLWGLWPLDVIAAIAARLSHEPRSSVSLVLWS
jgi:hypothetical protein